MKKFFKCLSIIFILYLLLEIITKYWVVILSICFVILLILCIFNKKHDISFRCILAFIIFIIYISILIKGTKYYNGKDEVLIVDTPETIKNEETYKENENLYYLDLVPDVNEKEFKLSCQELVNKDINEDSIGKYVTKELIFDGGIVDDEGYTLYKCGSTEDFLEDISGYQKTYNVYRIKDFRIEKDFPIEKSDVIRIYGIVEDVSKSYQTGDYNPTIRMYYAEYVRRYGENIENAKSEEEIKLERDQFYKELEYKDTINSDYNGTTKNVENMNELSLSEFMECCDSMNLQDVVNSNKNFTGNYVKLHIQISERKIFKNDDAKNKRIGKWTEIENVQDDICYCMLYNERVDEYVYPKSKVDTLYFLNTDNIDSSKLSKGDNLIVYGQLIFHDKESGQFEMLVRYYEIE